MAEWDDDFHGWIREFSDLMFSKLLSSVIHKGYLHPVIRLRISIFLSFELDEFTRYMMYWPKSGDSPYFEA